MAKLEKQSTSPPPGQIKHDDHSFGVLDPSSYNDHGTPTTADDTLFFGSGNRPTNFNISTDSKTGIELGLKIHEFKGADVIPTSFDSDGTAHYTVQHGLSSQTGFGGSERGFWNFDYSVNTGPNQTLDNFDFRIIIKSGDVGEVGTFDRVHTPTGTAWVDVAHNAAFGDDDAGNAHLAQNSVNLDFASLRALFGADTFDAHETYDITLQAFDHGKIVAQVHDVLVLV
jgi:hypothetical protein